jgi:hypothetical protein
MFSLDGAVRLKPTQTSQNLRRQQIREMLDSEFKAVTEEFIEKVFFLMLPPSRSNYTVRQVRYRTNNKTKK